ncbi:glycosyltransferase [Sphingomonas jatrophae]|uniref:Glycosyltransferase involved in cell wall bisynthesis n=1 Tax=Sphingomonas jatrophae TaxID=1166337 RepID=A0A1I6L659_9SPHN|nr:glycosyltransferase [Sphingomonas jatrophae]SFR98927.1 Glycosyltransferase involved in cell wall bisynthesis [Sphingomonas jatrophae]
MTILYLSQNGITEHIGESQIAPYVLGLAAQGYRIHLLTAEKADRSALAADYRARFDAAGVRWTTIRYHNRPPVLGQLLDLIVMTWTAWRIARREKIVAVHSRSHPPMPVALLLKRLTGARVLFDFRDFWADSGLAHGRFKPLFRWIKRRERGMVQQSDRMVTLTQAAADYLAATYPNPDGSGESRYSVIPCCADFAHFRPVDGTPARAQLGIAADATVMLYLGSIGAVYLVPQMMALFAELRRLRPGAVFLLVCNNGVEEIEAAADAAGIPREALRIVHAARDEVPGLIGAADVAVAFKRADLSNLGCSPIKIGEMLACGVPVIANGGVGDLDRLLAPEINGSLTLPDFAPATMRAALETVLTARLPRDAIRNAAACFQLEPGVDAYAAAYNALGVLPNRGPMVSASSPTDMKTA